MGMDPFGHVRGFGDGEVGVRLDRFEASEREAEVKKTAGQARLEDFRIHHEVGVEIILKNAGGVLEPRDEVVPSNGTMALAPRGSSQLDKW